MKNKLETIFWNPFIKIAGWPAFCVGIVFVLTTVVVGWLSQTVFIGIFQVKFITSAITLGKALAIQFTGLGILVAVMYILGTVLSKNVRFADILGTITLSRWPFLLAAIPGFFFNVPNPDEVIESVFAGSFRMGDIGGLLTASVFIMGFAIYSAILLFKAYSTSTGLKGGKLWGSFIASVIITEVIAGIISYGVLL